MEEKESFDRDEDGVAILPSSQYIYTHVNQYGRGGVFIDTKTLSVLTLGKACDRNSWDGMGMGMGRRHMIPVAAPDAEPSQETERKAERKEEEKVEKEWEGIRCGKGIRESQMHGWGVLQLPMEGLTSEQRGRICEEAKAQALRNKEALDHMGTHCRVADAAGVAIAHAVGVELRKVHPAVKVKMTSAFVIHYPAGSAGHVRHVDTHSDLTINVCLGAEGFRGGAMKFLPIRIPPAIFPPPPVLDGPVAVDQPYPMIPQPAGFFARIKGALTPTRRSPSPTRRSPSPVPEAEEFKVLPLPKHHPAVPPEDAAPGEFKVPHLIGHAVIHSGHLEHATEPVTHGDRYNLVIFCAIEYDTFDFMRLPADMKRYVASFLDATTLSRLASTCRAARAAASADELWLRLLRYHPLWRECRADARALHAQGASGRKLFDGLQRLQYVRSSMGGQIRANMPQMVCKETIQMAQEREGREAMAAEFTALKVMAAGGGSGGHKVQQFRNRPAEDFVPPPWLPSASFPEFSKREMSKPTIGPSWDEKEEEEMPKVEEPSPAAPPPFERLGLALPGRPPRGGSIHTFSSPLRAKPTRAGLRDLMDAMDNTPGSTPSRYIDTDGTDMYVNLLVVFLVNCYSPISHPAPHTRGSGSPMRACHLTLDPAFASLSLLKSTAAPMSTR